MQIKEGFSLASIYICRIAILSIIQLIGMFVTLNYRQSVFRERGAGSLCARKFASR